MKFSLAIPVLAGLAAASPAQVLETRQAVGLTANDLRGACRDILFIFARGSTELGNMGSIAGPPCANNLKGKYGSRFGVQGVDYAAALTTNFLPKGGDPAGIRDMKNKLEQAVNKCPNTIILAGGYSQGAAVTHETVKQLSQTVKDRITAIVTFGDTQNLQDRYQIPGYPRDRTKIICIAGDLVCTGTLIITASHLLYASSARECSDFFVQKIEAARA